MGESTRFARFFYHMQQPKSDLEFFFEEDQFKRRNSIKQKKQSNQHKVFAGPQKLVQNFFLKKTKSSESTLSSRRNDSTNIRTFLSFKNWSRNFFERGQIK